MDRELRLSNLSVPRQGLIRLCQSTNYGEITNLTVRDCQPVLSDPQSAVLVDIKLDSEQHPRQEADQFDFLLSAEVVRLMTLLDELKNGTISRLEVRAGIPRRIVWDKRVAGAIAT
jgi:hypothetical protein